jgi:hypothetical protein
MSSEAKAIECSIQLKEGSVVYQKKPDGYRICCLPVQVRKLWELTFVLSNLAYSGWRASGAKLYLGIGLDTPGRYQQTVRTMDLRGVALYDCYELWRVESFGRAQQEEVIVTKLVSQLPALSERNRSRATYHIESERIEGLHHAQQ